MYEERSGLVLWLSPYRADSLFHAVSVDAFDDADATVGNFRVSCESNIKLTVLPFERVEPILLRDAPYPTWRKRQFPP